MKVLVTGGAGFIGWHVVQALLDKKHEVVVLDNLSTGRKENIHPAVAFFKLDVASDALSEFFTTERFDHVIHLAAQTAVPKSLLQPDYDCRVNVMGTINILEAARQTGVKRVIFASSAAVYGDVATIPVSEDSAVAPNSFYGLSKLTAEQYLKLYSECFGLEYVVLRYANVYGERQGDAGEGGVVSIFCKRFYSEQDIDIFGDGGQTRDFIYAGDVANANCLALVTKYPNNIYNISTAYETSVNVLADQLKLVSGRNPARNYLPARDGDIYRSALDNAAAVAKLGWRPAVGLPAGLTATYNSLADLK